MATTATKPKKPPPPHVMDAIFAGDTEKIKAYGRAGGRATARVTKQRVQMQELERGTLGPHKRSQKQSPCPTVAAERKTPVKVTTQTRVNKLQGELF